MGTSKFFPLNHRCYPTANSLVPHTALQKSATGTSSSGEKPNAPNGDTLKIGFRFTVESSQISKKIFNL